MLRLLPSLVTVSPPGAASGPAEFRSTYLDQNSEQVHH